MNVPGLVEQAIPAEPLTKQAASDAWSGGDRTP